ncbi:MAG: hypothetical protein KatS3mg094_208 [Candidatus Parcubacteria bacterium]|nr:MAG: hypothetical protein KatS3mg094_208 [Candidatus Parcubacteria bacterium]
MTEERDYIYLKGTEELGEVIDALKEIQAKEIIIVVPRNTKCFLNSTNISILRSEINKLRKKIYIDSDDERINSLARANGLDIFLSDYGPDEATKIVTDILPPQKSKPVVKNIKNYDQAVNKNKKNNKNLTLVGIFIILIILGGYFILVKYLAYFNLNIILKTEKQPIEETITLSANVVKPDLENLIFPAEYIEIIKNHSIRQKASGLKSGSNSLRGKVKFINKDLENSISLVPGTRIQTGEGNIYRTLERVNLEKGGNQEVTIFAEKNDPKYYLTDLNTTFTIPGLKGSSWENKIEVKILEPITGGEGSVRIVSLDDITDGKLNLEKQISEILKQELKIKYSNYIFPEDLGIFDFKIVNVSHNVGQQADEIIFTGIGTLKTIGIKENDLKEYLKDIISKQNLRQDINFKIVNLKINSVTINDNFNFLKNKEMTVSLSGEVEVKGDIDVKKLTAEIAGQDVKGVKNYLDKYSSIEKAELLIFPPWLNKLPLDISKINVKIK